MELGGEYSLPVVGASGTHPLHTLTLVEGPRDLKNLFLLLLTTGTKAVVHFLNSRSPGFY